MELRDFAERVLFAESLEEKLAAPDVGMTDEHPGQPARIALPSRPAKLQIRKRKRGAKMPHPKALVEPRLRGVAHHILANHELQAVEVMAWTLCAFPEAPPSFRSGLYRILCEEQRHTRMHMRRLEQMGMGFGDLPVSAYVWRRVQQCENLREYLACLPLTFEAGNLDHSLFYADLFANAGDEKSAAVLRAIHRDEIGHVAFGVRWFQTLRVSARPLWEEYAHHLRWPLGPHYARGRTLNADARRRAGLPEEFIDQLKQAVHPSLQSE